METGFGLKLTSLCAGSFRLDDVALIDGRGGRSPAGNVDLNVPGRIVQRGLADHDVVIAREASTECTAELMYNTSVPSLTDTV